MKTEYVDPKWEYQGKTPAQVGCMPIIVLFCILIGFLGCNDLKDEQIVNWIANHKKPIAVLAGDTTIASKRRYTFIDADANVYETGPTYFVFPDTLKTSIKLIEK